MTQMRSIYSDVLWLSSGTIATLTGKTRYEDIDNIAINFADFVADNEARGRRYLDWQQAWGEFRAEA